LKSKLSFTPFMDSSGSESDEKYEE